MGRHRVCDRKMNRSEARGGVGTDAVLESARGSTHPLSMVGTECAVLGATCRCNRPKHAERLRKQVPTRDHHGAELAPLSYTAF